MKFNIKKFTLLALTSLMVGTFSAFSFFVVKTTSTSDSNNDRMFIGEYTNIKQEKLSDTTYRLTATIYPSDATYKNVRWDIYWNNSESTFAKDKNVYDYVEVVETSSDSLSITIECLQAFGEQIVVKVTSLDNSDAYAMCVLEYGRKVLSVEATLNGYTSSDDITIMNNSNVVLDAVVTYSDVYTYNSIYEISYEFIDASDYTVDTQGEQGTYYVSLANPFFARLVNTSEVYSSTNLREYLSTTASSYGTHRYSYLDGYGSMIWDSYKEVTLTELISRISKTSYTFKVTVDGIEASIKAKFDCSTAVSSVSMNESSVVF